MIKDLIPDPNTKPAPGSCVKCGGNLVVTVLYPNKLLCAVCLRLPIVCVCLSGCLSQRV